MVKVMLEPKSEAQFFAALEKYAKRSKQTLKDATLEQAALACRDAAMFTPPLVKGGGRWLDVAAQKAGEQAIDRDVGKVVVAQTGGTKNSQKARLIKRLGSLALNNNSVLFWRVASKGHAVLSGNVFISRMLSGTSNGFGTEWGFQKLRNYFNRIGTKVSSEMANTAYLQDTGEIAAKYRPIYLRTGGRLYKNGRNVSGVNWMFKSVAENKEDIRAFVEMRQRTVGAIKSGWAAALRSLPKPVINGVPSDFGVDLLKATWITKHKSVAGYNMSSFSDRAAFVSITNANGNVNGIATQADVLGLVYGNRVKQMPARVRRLLQDDIDKFNNKT